MFECCVQKDPRTGFKVVARGFGAGAYFANAGSCTETKPQCNIKASFGIDLKTRSPTLALGLFVLGAFESDVQGRPGQARLGQGRAGQGRAGQGEARRGEARRGEARQGTARRGAARRGTARHCNIVDKSTRRTSAFMSVSA